MADPAPVPPLAVLPDSTPDPVVYIERPDLEIDLATVIGLGASLALIAFAVWMEGSGANFFNLPSVFIVIFGTIAVTSISYSWEDLTTAWDTIKSSIIRRTTRLQTMATQIVDLSVLARKKGLLSLSSYDQELSKDPFLKQAVQLVTDGFQAPDIEHFLQQEIETGMERQRRLAGILRRASEIAPGMGLIGTLVGLVQMLSQLDNPATIGPAMAIALLTTFYGAVISTVVLAPLAVKIERNAGEDALLKTIVMAGAASMSRHENPRRLEIVLNSLLPPSSKIRYFD